jgi:hypothetical protein
MSDETPKHPDTGTVYIPEDVCMDKSHAHGSFPIAVVNGDGSLQFGEGHGMRDGEPLNGAMMATRGPDGLFHTVDLGTGPAQVATKAYRDGWDRTFN